VLVLTWPMWTRTGYGLARDMVFTPRYPWGPEAVGAGAGLPRAVPLDGVLAAATTLVDGAVVFRVAIVAVLLLASWGAVRLADAAFAGRAVAAVVAVWNPFVVERLALGQWALLASYAALPWLLVWWRRARAGDPVAGAALVPATCLGSLTPSGGLVLLGVSVVAALVPGPGTWARRAWPVLVAFLAQAPWVAASLWADAVGTSDPLGVAAFAARGEGGRGPWLTLLGGGGAWSASVAPSSSTTWLGGLLVAVALVAVIVALPRLWREHRPLLVAGLLSVPVAGLAHLPGGSDLLTFLVTEVPGGGLLRDGQKWLVPWVMLVVVAAAIAADRGVARVRDRDLALAVGALLVAAPVAVLPDAPVRTWEALAPVHYPGDLREAVHVLDAAPASSGAVVTLPFTSYRSYPWGHDLSAADPVARWARHEVVVSDALETRLGTVAGEDPRARQVSAALDSDDPLDSLADVGVGWVLVLAVRSEDPATAPPPEPTRLERALAARPAVVDGPSVRLVRVSSSPVVEPRQGARYAAALTVFAGWSALLIGGLLAAPLARRRRAAIDGVARH